MCFDPNPEEWHNLMVFMRDYMPGGKTREQALQTPGNCVKSHERGPGGMPKHHGRLLFFDDVENRAVVLGHNDVVSPPFVWRGSISRYHQVWDID